MHRVVLAVILVAMVALGSAGVISNRSAAESSNSDATPTANSTDLLAFCPTVAEAGTPTPGAGWKETDVRPPAPRAAAVIPATELLESEPAPQRALYLVEIRLPPGECIPAVAEGNEKDGAIVMIVQQGIVEYIWEPAPESTTPIVTRGDMASVEGTPVTSRTKQILYPGDWVAQDQQISFAYRNIGGEPAIIIKAVWAVPNFESGGHGGSK